MKPGIHTLAAASYHADPSDQPSLSASIAPAPYPFCRHPELCAGRTSCPSDPACNH